MRALDLGPLLQAARRASRALAKLPAARRDAALDAVAAAIEARTDDISRANAADLAEARELPAALKDRLKLTPARIAALASAVRAVRAQADPLGGSRPLGAGPSGIRVTKQRVPLGVIAIVYEARPNVTAECAALTIKSGNAVILRGGKEARRSNAAIAAAVREGLEREGIDPAAVTSIEDPGRDTVVSLLRATGQVDLVIPRGGAGLMAMVDEHARVPVIRHGQGICHVFVDAAADRSMAIEIAFNAKAQRPGVCNAMETLLVHEARAADVLPELGRRLHENGFELRADRQAQELLQAAGLTVAAASEQDWDTEFLGPVLAIRTVCDLDEALSHIAAHGTNHTAAIVTGDEAHARRFLDEVDASCVLWNASTRFNDGGELGLGAEMGISTSKLHAYGPMSALELTTEKLVVYGAGQVRS